MTQLFISHSSRNNPEALALSQWLTAEGWDDQFLDIDPQRGIVGGERWERALHQAVGRCDAVLFLVSPDWLRSDWCRREFIIAQQLGKRLFVLLLDGAKRADVEASMKEIWQLVDLSSGDDHTAREVTLPDETRTRHVYFSRSALMRLRAGLQKAGLDPQSFPWPPSDEPNRAPYRGLAPLEAQDAGIFFGREAPITELLAQLRGLREAAPPRFLAILGASGAGKSSFLRAGILPRLERDDRHFLPLPVIRPERAVLSGSNGLVECLWTTRRERKLHWSRRQIEEAVATGASALQALLQELAQQGQVPEWDGSPPQSPTLVLAIDQAEELFQAEGAEQAGRFLGLLAELLQADTPKLIVLCTIRSDSYEPLQSAPALADITQRVFSLPPMPHGAFRQVIEAPVALLKHSARPLRIEPQLTEALLRDIAEGGAKDALPLLAFTLERLYVDYSADGLLSLKDYQDLGRIAGAIEKAVSAALDQAQRNPKLPNDRDECLKLLRRGLIPWMAGIDRHSNLPYRKVALLSQVPEEARALIEHFVEFRLLAKDKNADGEITIEPAHEALLRQWTTLKGWLEEDTAALATLESVKAASRDWASNDCKREWLVHASGRLEDAEALNRWAVLAANFDEADLAYLAECRAMDTELRDRELWQARELAEAHAERLIAVNSMLETASRRALGRAYEKLEEGDASAYLAYLSESLSYSSKVASEEAALAIQREISPSFYRAIDRVTGKLLEGLPAAIASRVSQDSVEIETNPTTSAVRWNLRHLGIRFVRFSKDGARIITVGSKDVRTWHANDGTELCRPFKIGRKWKISSVGIDDYATKIALQRKSWFFKDIVEILDVTTNTKVRVGQPSRLLFSVFSPDATILSTANSSGLQSWDTRTGARIGVEMPHDQSISAAAFSPDSITIMTGDRKGVIRIWDAKSGKLISQKQCHSKAITSVDFGPDGRIFSSASQDTTARVWETFQINPISPPLHHADAVGRVAFSADGRYIITTTAHYELAYLSLTHLFGMNLPPILADKSSIYHAVRSVAFDYNSSRSALAVEDRVVMLDLQNSESLGAPVTPEELISLSGRRVSTNGRMEWLRPEEWETLISDTVSLLSRETNNKSKILAWHFSEPSSRTISPYSRVTIPKYIEREIDWVLANHQQPLAENFLALRDAYHLDPGHPLILLALSVFDPLQQAEKKALWKRLSFPRFEKDPRLAARAAEILLIDKDPENALKAAQMALNLPSATEADKAKAQAVLAKINTSES